MLQKERLKFLTMLHAANYKLFTHTHTHTYVQATADKLLSCLTSFRNIKYFKLTSTEGGRISTIH